MSLIAIHCILWVPESPLSWEINEDGPNLKNFLPLWDKETWLILEQVPEDMSLTNMLWEKKQFLICGKVVGVLD